MATLRLLPLDRSLALAPGTALAGALAEAQVEMPCGGRGRCGRCRVRVLAGEAAIHDADRQVLGDLTADGWRLGCRLVAEGDVTLEVGAWATPILSDGACAPEAGEGAAAIAVDLGTTTIAAQAVDGRGRVVGVASCLNPQVRWGADVVSRIDHALAGRAGELRDAARLAIASLCREVAERLPGAARLPVVIAGNTVMHHLLCGCDVTPLARLPFASPLDGVATLAGGELGWERAATVTVLPALGGFVGGDIAAGVLATGLLQAARPTVLLDLGTNGEIALGLEGRLWVAATAAGPAFEGAGISCGMRAATGAITHALADGDGIRWTVLGGGRARGICGSGLVDAVALALDRGWLAPNGRLARESIPLIDALALSQRDIRALQMAKGAIAAGLERVCAAAGIALAEVEVIHLAGAFGNYLDARSALRIGLLPPPFARLQPAGNTSLSGARLAAVRGDDLSWLRSHATVVGLDSDPGFVEAYAAAMAFPAPA